VKLTIYLHLLPKSSMVDLYLHSPIRLHGTVLNELRILITVLMLYAVTQGQDMAHLSAGRAMKSNSTSRVVAQLVKKFLASYVTRRCIAIFARGRHWLSFLSQLNPLHIIPWYFLTIHFNTALPSMLRSTQILHTALQYR
jgi:hypothetical protein